MPVKGLESDEDLDETLGGEPLNDRITLSPEQVDISELQIPDEQGEIATLSIFPGILKDGGEQRYQEFNKRGYLSDQQGNLVDTDGNIMVPARQLATLINKLKRGEEIDMPMGTLVSIIYEKGDEMPEEGEMLFELDPSAELERGETNACHSCSNKLGFRFEELWGGETCGCQSAPSCSCCSTCQAPTCDCQCTRTTTHVCKG